jgi:hypothetical protein
MPVIQPKKAVEHSATPAVLQLPLWPNSVRGIPNSIARSALFNVANLRKGERKHYRQREIAALNGIGITYTGEELRQDDEDVFLQILHLARTHDLGMEVEFTGHSLLTALTWTINSASKARLVACLHRLTATALSISVTGRDGLREGYAGSLIRSFSWQDAATGKAMRKWAVLLEPKIAALFDPACYSRLDWELRMQLPPLAKFLHTFYHTHAMPFHYKVENLHRLTDSDAKSMRHFRADLKKALGLLIERGFFLSAIIDPRTDTVQVVRKHQIEA